MTDTNLLKALAAIDPAALDYAEWSSVGMALKHEGHTASDWDAWSRGDKRYKAGECFRKWDSFRGTDNPVTGGTIVAIARSHGWTPATDEGHGLEWDDTIGSRDEVVIIADTAWVEPVDVMEPGDNWDAVADLTKYLETLFEANENVGYVTTSWEKEGRHLPTKGNWDRTAGQLIEELGACEGDIGRVVGDYKPEAGAWIRFNPLDGHGCRNDNVTEFRYALVESDTMEVAKQEAIIRQLELPVACLVSSAGKSVHAIVRIDAADYDEYRKRVDHLYSVCKRNGLAIDSANKNPSRLSRMPGATRCGRKQYLIDTNIGKADWAEWAEWMEAETDTLPVDVTDFDAEWDEELTPSDWIIEGVLGTHEKMMLSGPSKAGKSFALLQLCAAIAEGDTWMGMRVKQGHVLYINLELKRDSRIRRLKEVFAVNGYGKANLNRIHSLDLRGLSAPLEQLTSKIVRQAAKYRCSTIIIDPIYKIMAGDENSAESVARFCNQLDNLSRMLDCSVVYCHHYSKGQQGQKSSMDRASGSGVFARDVDTLFAMTELEVTEAARKAYLNTLECAHIASFLDGCGIGGAWRDGISQDAQVVANDFRDAAKGLLAVETMNALIAELAVLGRAVADASAWRLESTLREFAPMKPIDVWYRWPAHYPDAVLADAKIADIAAAENSHRRGGDATKKRADRKRSDKKELFEAALSQANFGDPATRKEVADYIGKYEGRTVTKEAVRKWMEQWPEYDVSGPEDGYVIVKKEVS